MMRIIVIPLEIPSQNAARGRDWRVAAARTRKIRCRWATLCRSQMALLGIPRATGPRRMHVVAYRRRRCADIANLIGGAKPCIDGLVDAGLLVDDRDSMATITYEQRLASEVGGARTRIDIMGES